jgi:hypothetical protein
VAIVGDLVANLTADISGFSAPLKKAETEVVGFSGMIKGLGGAVGGAMVGLLAGAGIVAGIGVAVNSFREAEQAGKKLDAVLAATGGAAGLTGGEIRELANDLQSVTNFEGDATVAAAGVLATFREIKGDVFKQAIISAQDLSSVMGQDLNSSIVQVGKALNDPIKGVTALQRVGVSFSQQQKDQIKALQQSGDLAGAQAVILKELQGEFGGAAQAMADPLTIAWNTIGDIVESIGSLFFPALVEIADFIVKEIVPATAGWGDTMKDVGLVIGGAVKAVLYFVRDAIAAINGLFAMIGLGFGEELGKEADKAIDGAAERLKKIGMPNIGDVVAGEKKKDASAVAMGIKNSAPALQGSREALTSIFAAQQGPVWQNRLLKLQEDANRFLKEGNDIAKAAADAEEVVDIE